MGVSTRTYNQFLSSAINTVATKAKATLDTRVGSVIRAMYEAASLQWIFLQSLILQVQNLTRAVTSTGADLDSWWADFGFTRLPATYDTGPVQLIRYSPNSSQPIAPVGALVQTGLGNIQYKIVADTSNTAYSAALNGYQCAANAGTLSVTAQAMVAGTGSNVIAGAINQMVTPLPGFDAVSNPNPINNALDAESDTAGRARFVLWITGGIIKATAAAIDSAIAGVQQGLSWIKLENQNVDGSTHNGYFAVVAQDGSGTLTTTEQTNISNAIEATRGFTIGFGLFTPTNVSVPATMTAVLPSSVSASDATAAKAAASNAVASYINALAIGQLVPYQRVADVAIDAMVSSLSPLGYTTSGVTVDSYTLNGGTTDVAITATSIARAGTITVN